MKDWLTYGEAYLQEDEQRLNIKPDELCSYGIEVLDDPLINIAKNELVIIGADSGVGKSSLILDIARHNAQNKKKVALFYLEGGHLEAIQRLKWRDICELFYKERGEHQFVDMDFRKWALNCGEDLTKLSSRVYAEQKDKYRNLFLYPISEGFKIEELLDSLLGFHKLVPDKTGIFAKEGVYDLDLIIIDHLQYFSLDKDDNEITEITKILRECKKITDHHNIPIILVSHLRKKGKDRGLPDQEDFYGSSNIPKIATTAITIAPDTKDDDLSTGIFPTYFRIVKSRIGLRANYAMRCNYNLTLRAYEKKYQIFRLDGLGNILPELSEDKLPRWAKPKG
jgi:hypothetical protein